MSDPLTPNVVQLDKARDSKFRRLFEEALAIEVAQYLGLNFCGIDLIRTKKSPVILEANAFPGIIGITAATKTPLAQILANEIAKG